MEWTAEEICRHYRQAKDKPGDIRVMADLNGVDEASIRAVLVDAGLLEPDAPTPKTDPVSQAAYASRKELAAAIRAELTAGGTDTEVARRVGCTTETVRSHRKKLEAEPKTEQKPEPKTEQKPKPKPKPEPVNEPEPVKEPKAGPEPKAVPAIKRDKGLPITARVAAIIHAMPPDAPESAKLACYELCKALMASAEL